MQFCWYQVDDGSAADSNVDAAGDDECAADSHVDAAVDDDSAFDTNIDDAFEHWTLVIITHSDAVDI